MAAKIDLEKAYDKLEWPIIKYTLQFDHFPAKIVDLIMACISSSTISILWNGKASIRQEDPLPYVFILCLNQLSLTLDQALHSKQLKPIRVGRHPILFNHVLFAYDIFLFSHATIPDCNTLLNIFHNFYNILGQVCSKEK